MLPIHLFRHYSANSKIYTALLLIRLCTPTSHAQVNSGSDGHDGALSPTSSLAIDMADHPDGIYQYTSVNIPSGVTVSFIPNAGNKSVVWLVQGDCVIAGTVSASGAGAGANVSGAKGGPGGYGGGNGALNSTSLPGEGHGPGGGTVGTDPTYLGGNGSFATLGDCTAAPQPLQFPPGPVYGNVFSVPLVGGSGGSGHDNGGGGGGGAMLIASSSTITISGTVTAQGGGGSYTLFYPGYGGYTYGNAGAGSGGAIRLIANTVTGSGSIDAGGGSALYETYSNYPFGAGYRYNSAGKGRIRIDTFADSFNGPTTGLVTRGFQPIILPVGTQNVQLAVQSIGGVAVVANPSGVLVNPDVIVPGQQSNPVPIVVKCTNVSLNSEITVVVQPANGAAVQAVGLNNVGTAAASTAIISVNLPRGGGIIYAKCVSGVAGSTSSSSNSTKAKTLSYAETGLTATGERFKAVEVTAPAGGKQQTTYVTPLGKRYPVPSN